MKKMLFGAAFIALAGLFCQAPYNELHAQFGKNKVQYRVFDWKFIESEHFDVYYDAGSKYLAEFCAIEAEKALLSIQNTLNFSVSKKIVLVVYDSHNDFQQTNVISSYMPEGVGGVTELFKNRVVLPFQGDYSQFRHVVHHELVHAVINDMFYAGSLQYAIMSGGRQIPLWMNEGLAEYESIGGMNVETDTYMRDLAISENFPQLKDMKDYLAYRGGQTFYAYVADKYGKEKITELINQLRILKNPEMAFKSSFNMSIDDFSEEFEKDSKKYYLPDLKTFEDPRDYATKMTDRKELNNFFNSSPAISPDGEKMAYISDRDGLFGIYISGLSKGDKPKKIIGSLRQQDFEQLNILTPGISWNPAGTKLAISAKSGGEDAIFIVDAKDGSYDKFTYGFHSINSAQWSPDGKYIAFVATLKSKNDIFIMDVSTNKIENLTDDIFSDAIPCWAPDSKSIYFISNRNQILDKKVNADNFKIWDHEFNSSDIYKIDLAEKNISRITQDPENKKTSIAISADGKEMLYISDKNGIGNIYDLNLLTNVIKPVTNSLTNISQISLAKDNSKALFTTQVKSGYDIFLLKTPFEITKNKDLPLTEFKTKKMSGSKEQEKLVLVADSLLKVNADRPPLTYGEFAVDFKKQQVVESSGDVIVKKDEPAVGTLNPTNNMSFVEKDYETVFSKDFYSFVPQYNTYNGGQGQLYVLFSDILGDNQIELQASLLSDLKNSQFNVSYNYLPKIIDYQFSVHHYSTSFIYTTTSNDQMLDQYRNYGFDVTAFYPFDLFSRVELGTSLIVGSKTRTLTSSGVTTDGSTSRTLLNLQTRYVYDNAMGGLFAPIMGSRGYFQVLFSPKYSSEALGFFTLKFDYRKYFHIWDYISFAIRGSAGASFGANSQNFSIGGVENWIGAGESDYKNRTDLFQNPEDFMFLDNFVSPVRGWRIGELRNKKFFVTNFELRFPVPILIQYVMGNIFFDMGGAWDDKFVISGKDAFGNGVLPINMIMSAGTGIRTVLLGLPMKFDIAWKNNYTGWSKPVYIFSLGLDF